MKRPTEFYYCAHRPDWWNIPSGEQRVCPAPNQRLQPARVPEALPLRTPSPSLHRTIPCTYTCTQKPVDTFLQAVAHKTIKFLLYESGWRSLAWLSNFALAAAQRLSIAKHVDKRMASFLALNPASLPVLCVCVYIYIYIDTHVHFHCERPPPVYCVFFLKHSRTLL